ncbi:alpha-1,2-fucosyltransferase [bacterium]|nr:alpha-1,2-fucosyltransferase [bacterium]
MIVVKLMGGLGNQMFQYAFGRALETHLNYKVFYDKSWFCQNLINVTPRNFELEAFGLSLNYIDPTRLFFSNNQHSWLKILKQKIKGKIICNKVYEKSFALDQLKTKNNLYLEGYWQNPKYFEGIREIILKDFSFPELKNPEDNDLQNQILTSESVAVHIRRGDYIDNPTTNQFHGTCSIEYYKKAAELIVSKVKNAKFFLFTDDHDFVKDNFRFLPSTILVSDSKRSDIDELNLMHLCKHFIIANSSFSWWGTWLSQNQEKIVIAPQKWFNNVEAEKNCKIVSENWVRI